MSLAGDIRTQGASQRCIVRSRARAHAIASISLAALRSLCVSLITIVIMVTIIVIIMVANSSNSNNNKKKSDKILLRDEGKEADTCREIYFLSSPPPLTFARAKAEGGGSKTSSFSILISFNFDSANKKDVRSRGYSKRKATLGWLARERYKQKKDARVLSRRLARFLLYLFHSRANRITPIYDLLPPKRLPFNVAACGSVFNSLSLSLSLSLTLDNRQLCIP